ncbi:MAG TPA: CBS domain-containing protein [Planctomycetota bacterium]|nr:CBS domain-containing protein [Planctomycetota bacterium]
MTKLAEVRARDLMRTEVVTLTADATIREAVETLQDDRLGGVPVLDGAGKVVGFLSLADIARIEHLQGDRLAEARGDRQLSNPIGEALEEESVDDEEFASREDYSPELLGHETVGQWMTRGVISVPPDATLKELCATMVKESVHRLVVLERGRLKGIISTMDVVRHVAEHA